LRVINLRAVINGVEILKGVDVEVRRGDIHLLVGPNGSGKTTLLRSIMGLVEIRSGRVVVDGVDVTGKKPHEIAKMGVIMAPCGGRVAHNLTVLDNLKIAGELKSEIFEIFPALRDLLNRKAGSLSGGERQMVVLARAYLAKPKYLLLDEPFTYLHSDVKSNVIEMVEEMAEEGVGILLATHEEAEKMLSLSDVVSILIGGKIVYSGGVDKAKEMMSKYLL